MADYLLGDTAGLVESSAVAAKRRPRRWRPSSPSRAAAADAAEGGSRMASPVARRFRSSRDGPGTDSVRLPVADSRASAISSFPPTRGVSMRGRIADRARTPRAPACGPGTAAMPSATRRTGRARRRHCTRRRTSPCSWARAAAASQRWRACSSGQAGRCCRTTAWCCARRQTAVRALPTYPSLRLQPDSLDALFPGDTAAGPCRRTRTSGGSTCRKRCPRPPPADVAAMYFLGDPAAGRDRLHDRAACARHRLHPPDGTELPARRTAIAKPSGACWDGLARSSRECHRSRSISAGLQPLRGPGRARSSSISPSSPSITPGLTSHGTTACLPKTITRYATTAG